MKTKIKPSLKFLIPIFNIKVKVYLGDIDTIIEQQKVNVLPPCGALQWTDNDTLCIALPDPNTISEDQFVELINHETTHTTFDLFAMIGSPINQSTEEFFAYIDTWIKSYIKENL